MPRILTKSGLDRNRKIWIDELRTIAIVIMVFANSAAYFIPDEVNVHFRILSSLAAPMFIFLAGVSLSFSDGAPSKKFLIRGGYLLITAALIDLLAWKILPFETFDVLYLISFGIVLCGLIQYGWKADLSIGVAFIVLSFFVRASYNFEMTESQFLMNDFSYQSNFKEILKRAFIDGWFPLFPWIGFMFLGRALFSNLERLNSRILFWSNLIIFIAFFTLIQQSANNPIRTNYIEIFYPVRALYLVLSFSFILLAIALAKKLEVNWNGIKKYTSIGRNSLFVYMLHCFFTSYLADLFPVKELAGLGIFCVVQLIFLYSMAWIVERSSVVVLISIFPVAIQKVLGFK